MASVKNVEILDYLPRRIIFKNWLRLVLYYLCDDSKSIADMSLQNRTMRPLNPTIFVYDDCTCNI